MSFDPDDETGIDPFTRERIADWARENVEYWRGLEGQDHSVTEEEMQNAPKPPPGIGHDIAALGAQTVAMAIEYFRTGKLGEPVDGRVMPVPSVESKLITAEMVAKFMEGRDISREEGYRRFADVWSKHMGEL